MWRHKISENPALRDALIRKLLEVAAEDAPRFIAGAVLDDPTFRNPRFVEFSSPQGLQVQEAWVSQTGSVLLDVELRVDYRLEFEVLTRPLPLPQTGSYAWTPRTTSRPAVLTFEVIQHEPESEPTNFAARLTGFADPGSWVFAGPLE